MSRRREIIEVRSNLKLTMRERGKIVARREGHNIWLRLGAEWLANLIQYATMGLPQYWHTPEDVVTYLTDYRIRGIGVGVGGTQQLVIPTPAYCNTYYPGNNQQTDTDPTVTALERPVRITNTVTPDAAPPTDYGLASGDVWLGQVTCPASMPTATSVTFSRLFLPTEISYNTTFPSMPLSECALVTGQADPTKPLLYPSYNIGTGVAYDTFDTLSKTNAFDLEIDWTIRF
jgi:hypothetical protein